MFVSLTARLGGNEASIQALTIGLSKLAHAETARERQGRAG